MATRSTKMTGHGNRKSWGSRTNPPLSAMGSPGSDDERLDADTILVAQLRGRSQQASESQVKSHLKQEAETVATKPENSLVYANVRGFSILENLDNLMSEISELKRESKKNIDRLTFEARVSKNRIETLESEARESKTQIDTQDHNLLALEGRVTDLSYTSQGYLDIRMRFLDNYNKKVKRDPAFQHTSAIDLGNIRAHNGDAKVDATLFRDQKRREDPKTYKELYGVDHSVTLGLGGRAFEGKILQVLNARATQVAQKRPFSPELEAAFNLYLAKIDQLGIGKAARNFWKLYNREYPHAD